MRVTACLATLVLAALTSAAAGGCATKARRLTRVMVTGDSRLKAKPDTAVLVLSVVTQNRQALGAQQENAHRSDAVIQAVKDAVGPGLEVKTSDYSLQPQRSYGDHRFPKILGYEARNSVTVTLGDLDKVGAVIDAATRAGANSVESVSFILSDASPARGQTLAEATRQAMSKAEAIAQALGGRVARVVEEQEGGFVARPFEGGREDAASAGPVAYQAKMSPITPVEAGSLNVASRVQLTVEIETPP